MADVVQNSPSNSTVRMDLAAENSKEEHSNNGVTASSDHTGSVKEDNTTTEAGKREKEKTGGGGGEASKMLLRPSALSQNTFTLKSSALAPSNPFLKISTSNKFGIPDDESLFGLNSKSEKTEVKPVTPSPHIPAPLPLSNPNYVFGQNISERVADKVSESVSNGTGALLFSAVASAAQANTTGEKSEVENGSKESSSLLEDAARCQEQRSAKRKYEEVQVTTGEEEEQNVLQITVKLFAFEGGSWVERGRGTLRLNDNSVTGQSRMVVRTMGNLRVVLNTKIWATMELSRASERSIRTTAMDPTGTLKIFLIQASPSDITTLFSHMDERLELCKARAKSGEEDRDEREPVSSEEPVPEKSAKVAALESVVVENPPKLSSPATEQQQPS